MKDGRAKLRTALRESGPADTLGAAGAVIGIILVVTGIALQENTGAGFGATIRVLGGVLFLGGLGVVLFWKPRRRSAVIGAARRIADRYIAATAGWRWPDRMGLAGVAIGLVLLAPALVIQILFGTVFGVMIIAPGIALFWAGAALLIYGRFYRRDATRKPPLSSPGSGRQPSRRGLPSRDATRKPPQSRREGRARDR